VSFFLSFFASYISLLNDDGHVKRDITVHCLVRVTMVDKNKTVICCLLATFAVMLTKKKKRTRKMCSKKCCLERNVSRDVHLLNELLEMECLEMMPSWCQQVN
jgi:hypothetical protein